MTLAFLELVRPVPATPAWTGGTFSWYQTQRNRGFCKRMQEQWAIAGHWATMKLLNTCWRASSFPQTPGKNTLGLVQCHYWLGRTT